MYFVCILRGCMKEILLLLRICFHRPIMISPQEQEFINVHTPIFTSHDCEGGGEVFQAIPASSSAPSTSSGTPTSPPPAPSEFFGKPVFLTVSGQLHAEILASALSRVYTFGPVFRAEPSQTSRHLAEFWMLEAEAAFIYSLSQLLDLTEASIQSATQYLLQICEADLAFLNQSTDPDLSRLRSAAEKPFVRMSYTEAISVLDRAQQAGKVQFDFPAHWGLPLQSEHERYLASDHCAHPVFVTDYPRNLKPFYMRANDGSNGVDDDPCATVACTDLLVPGIGELVGGSLREERLDRLESQMRAAGMDLDEYVWYLDLRRYGTVPHGGFGIGFERFLIYVTGLENVREVVACPRWVKNCRF